MPKRVRCPCWLEECPAGNLESHIIALCSAMLYVVLYSSLGSPRNPTRMTSRRKVGEMLGKRVRYDPESRWARKLSNDTIEMNQDMGIESLIDCLWSVFEARIRRMVKEEVDRASATLFTLSLQKTIPIPMESSRPQLVFLKALSLPIFTMRNIKDVSGNHLQIFLDDPSKSLAQHLSSLKIELLVLDGDFPGDFNDWTSGEFNNRIVTERTGKQPLLVGDVQFTLSRDGLVFSLAKLSFTDNSSWIRSHKFRIGARVAPDVGYNGPRIKEAITEAFMVKDHRGQAYKKHYPPSLGDHVWRLEGIHKGGAFHKKLKAVGINTVQDFLKLLYVDHNHIRSILGVGMSDHMWTGTIKHAKTCSVGEKQYIYRNSDGAIILNDICQVTVIFLDEVMYTLPQLNPQQRIILLKLAREARQNWDEVKDADTGLLTKINTALLQMTVHGTPDTQVDETKNLQLAIKSSLQNVAGDSDASNPLEHNIDSYKKQ